MSGVLHVKRTVSLSVRASEVVEVILRLEDRSFSSYVRTLIHNDIQRRGLWPDEVGERNDLLQRMRKAVV